MIVSLAAKAVRTIRFISPGLAEGFVKWVFAGESFFWLDRIYDFLTQQISNRLILLLPGRGCAWFKYSGGCGCTMCGFNQKLIEVNQKWHFSASDLLAFYQMADLLTRETKPQSFYIYNGGSFLNAEEIPLETQVGIARAIGKHPSLDLLFVESRPAFVTTDRLEMLLKNLGGKRLEVGIGLEAVSNIVRERYIHKGFNLADYEAAIRILKRHKAQVLTYVFLKPLGLLEKEAIEEAVKTIEYAFQVGTDEVSLSCAFVQAGTAMAAAYQGGEFSPPWLWSIIEVVRRTAHLGSVRIGSFEDTPPPLAIPHNCPQCSSLAEKALERYNLGRDISSFDGLHCTCKEQWRREIQKA